MKNHDFLLLSQGTPLRTLDGYFGKIKDVYFDDRTCRIQYFVEAAFPWSWR
jgi:uncharacterized protein YrrD